MVLPGEINFVVTTHKINNSERNSGHSSAERNSIITGRELQRSPSPADECSLSLDYLYHFVRRGTFSSKQLMPSILTDMSEQRIPCHNLQQNVFMHLKSCEIFIVFFWLTSLVLMLLPSRAFGFRGESCAHTITRPRQRLCPVSAESQMHTNGLWKYTDMQRRSARGREVSSLACQCLSCRPFQTTSCCVMTRGSQMPLIPQSC